MRALSPSRRGGSARWRTAVPALVFAVDCAAELEPGGVAAAVEELVEEYRAAGQLSGAVLVARRGKVLYRGAVGWAEEGLARGPLDRRYSSLDDLYRWHRALVEGRVLRPTSHERFLAPERAGYAYAGYVGWGSTEQIDALLASVREDAVEPAARDLHLAAFGGDLPGFHTLLVRRLDDLHAVVVLDNHDLTGFYDHRRIAHLGADLLRLLLGLPPRGPQPAYGPARIPPREVLERPCVGATPSGGA